MAGEPIITVVGNLAADPELRFTPGGKAVANFTVASTPRVKDGDQYVDGTTTWLRCSVWDQAAENVVESLQKGMRVIVQGRLSTREFEHKGEQRTALELAVDAIGPELRWATANVKRTERGGNGGGQQRQQSGGQSRQQAADPWATPAASSDPWATPNTSDEPPF
jgi:single-strand DNA-binding protein